MAIASLPSWERGLKSEKMQVYTYCVCVAPLVGAWIEIYDKLSDGIIELVAPLVGAWIEIRRTLYCL